MDATFFYGSAAFVSAVVIFVGSIWLLMALIMGGRLAYWVTASVTLAFVLMMSMVWSYGDPLGPVGTLPHWVGGDAVVGTEAPEGAPSGYPDSGPWRAPDTEDETEMGHVSELENAAKEVLDRELADEEIDTFPDSRVAIVETDSQRLAEQGGILYGAVTFTAAEPASGEEQIEFTPTVVAMRFDPGYPNRPAHILLGATFLLFVGHLFGLGRAERKARRSREDQTTTTVS